MNLYEKTTNKKSIYKGKIIDLEVHEVDLPNGESSTREIVLHNGAVAVCALTSENKIVLVEQFRKPLDNTMLEIPAGKLEIGEEREEAAKRELEEETGYKAKELTLITDMYGSPGFTNEKISIYLATELLKGEKQLDEDEFIELHELSINKAQEKLKNNEINDAKTIIALQYLLLNYNHSN
ncbi:NUDIX domain-containing protein [Staphylococcus durrellii]|uniref:NUDIX domain-containing protein n=1 Tax=Staphylococcus durrellii TaxID=2781773 RepID=UPI00189E633F|nr:NUDIX hydrolase [Staphylococcus durrellii]MBF7017060.1 NUDIX hydrolase [Staphylococcus durrellii]